MNDADLYTLLAGFDEMPFEKQEEAIAELLSSGNFDWSRLIQAGPKAWWDAEAQVIDRLGYPALHSYLPQLLKWLQDLNWPGTLSIIETLAKVPWKAIEALLKDDVEQAVRTEDEPWVLGIHALLRKSGHTFEDMVDRSTADAARALIE